MYTILLFVILATAALAQAIPPDPYAPNSNDHLSTKDILSVFVVCCVMSSIVVGLCVCWVVLSRKWYCKNKEYTPI